MTSAKSSTLTVVRIRPSNRGELVNTFQFSIYCNSCAHNHVLHWCCHKGKDTAAMTQTIWQCRQIGLQVDYQTGWSRSKSNMLFVTLLVCTDLRVCISTQAVNATLMFHFNWIISFICFITISWISASAHVWLWLHFRVQYFKDGARCLWLLWKDKWQVRKSSLYVARQDL